MDSYVVRVYRCDGQDPDGLAGVVEYAGVEEKETRAFRSTNELLGILSGRKAGHSREKRITARLKLRLPLRVTGTTVRGKKFTEDSILEDLSTSGAFFCLENHVAIDKKLVLLIDPERSGLDVKASVVKVIREMGKRRVGVLFEDKP